MKGEIKGVYIIPDDNTTNITPSKIIKRKSNKGRHMRYKTIEFRIKSILELHAKTLKKETRPFVKSNIERHIRLWTARLEWLRLQDKGDVRMHDVTALKYKFVIRYINNHKKQQEKDLKEMLKIEPNQ